MGAFVFLMCFKLMVLSSNFKMVIAKNQNGYGQNAEQTK